MKTLRTLSQQEPPIPISTIEHSIVHILSFLKSKQTCGGQFAMGNKNISPISRVLITWLGWFNTSDMEGSHHQLKKIFQDANHGQMESSDSNFGDQLSLAMAKFNFSRLQTIAPLLAEESKNDQDDPIA